MDSPNKKSKLTSELEFDLSKDLGGKLNDIKSVRCDSALLLINNIGYNFYEMIDKQTNKVINSTESLSNYKVVIARKRVETQKSILKELSDLQVFAKPY